MLEKLKRFNTDEWWERGYLIIFGIILAHHFLDTTMFMIPWPPKTGLVLYFLIMVYTIGKIMFHNTMSRKELIISAVILFCFITSAIVADYSFLFEVAFLIVGAKNVSFDKILKEYLVIGILILIAALVASQVGLIENLVYPSARGMDRKAFGTIYPTDFAAHLFYLNLAWLCINNRKVKLWDVLITVALIFIVFLECGAYTSTICLGLCIVAEITIWICKKKNYEPKYLTTFTWMPVLMGAMFIILTHLYRGGVQFWDRLNQVLSLRLQISAQGVQQYGYSLFGQNIAEVGNGGAVETRDNYFFLDDSYLRIALEYGVLILAIVLIVLIIIGKRAICEKRYMLLAALVLISIHCFMEQHMLEIAFNPFILCLFVDMQRLETKQQNRV